MVPWLMEQCVRILVVLAIASMVSFPPLKEAVS